MAKPLDYLIERGNFNAFLLLIDKFKDLDLDGYIKQYRMKLDSMEPGRREEMVDLLNKIEKELIERKLKLQQRLDMFALESRFKTLDHDKA